MSRPLTVAYLIPSLCPTGPIRVVLDLVKYLDRSRYVPVLVPLEASCCGDLLSFARQLGVAVRPLKGPWWRRGMTDFANTLTSIDASLLHVHCYAPMILAASMRRSIPTVLTLHNWPWLDYRELHGRIRGTLMWEVERRLLRRFNAVTPCSEALALELYSRGCGPVTPIANGVDPETFTPANREQRAAARRTLGIPLDAIVFIYVGKLIARKRILSVLAGYMSAGLDKCVLLVVGDGPLARHCGVIAEGRRDIVLAGFQSDISVMLRAADIYVSAAATEGLPLAVLEAYRAGLRLVLSDIPAHREVLEGREEAGCLYQMTEDLAILMRREAGRLRGSARSESGRDRFSAREMARKYARLYDRLTASVKCPILGTNSVNRKGEECRFQS